MENSLIIIPNDENIDVFYRKLEEKELHNDKMFEFMRLNKIMFDYSAVLMPDVYLSGIGNIVLDIDADTKTALAYLPSTLTERQIVELKNGKTKDIISECDNVFYAITNSDFKTEETGKDFFTYLEEKASDVTRTK